MNVGTAASEALQQIEGELARVPMGESDDGATLSERIHAVRLQLAAAGDQWIGTAQARRLLGFRSEERVLEWAHRGFVRSRTDADGRLEVLLDDVLFRREAAEGVSAFGGDFLTEEELEELHQSRPGTLPWERDPAARTG